MALHQRHNESDDEVLSFEEIVPPLEEPEEVCRKSEVKQEEDTEMAEVETEIEKMEISPKPQKKKRQSKITSFLTKA